MLILSTSKDGEKKQGLLQKNWLYTQFFFVMVISKDIYISIAWRALKYWEFCISRYEYKKYWVTEYQMRKIINTLKKEYIQLVRCEYYLKGWKPKKRNIFIATQKLFDIVKSFTTSIKNMNEKIIVWCKHNPIQKLRDLGVLVYNNGRIWAKNSKTTINKQNWAITNWKTWEKWNIFNYIKSITWYNTYYSFTHFIWK